MYSNKVSHLKQKQNQHLFSKTTNLFTQINTLFNYSTASVTLTDGLYRQLNAFSRPVEVRLPSL